MPQPCRFERSVVLEVSAQKAFEFHGNPNNVGRISPGWQHVAIKAAEETPRMGGEFKITIRFFGRWPLTWHGVWREVQEPTLLVDEALQSPFSFWRHRHEFRALASGRCLMTDHVEYLFPGRWIGKWFGETLGRVQFHVMFADRHARTRRWMHDHG